MFGLKQKLSIGFGGLLVILLIVGALGIAVLAQYRNALNTIFYENWRSVEYGQAMVDSLDRLNDIARPIAGPESVSVDALHRAGAEAGLSADSTAIKSASPSGVFEANCVNEDHNITLDGEGELASAVTRLWKGESLSGQKLPGDCYRDIYARLLDPSVQGDQRAKLFGRLSELGSQLKSQAHAVIQLNLDNMTPTDGKAKRMADSAIRMMALLLLAGSALAVLFTLLVGRSILRPLATVTKSIREIEQGNLDLVVQVKSRDELYQLAEAFNSMTAKLREFRRSDRARLVRTQRTTQLAVDSLPDAIAIISPEGKVELSNDTAQKLFRLQPGVEIATASDPRLRAIVREVVTADKPLERRGYESAVEVYDQSGQLKFFLPHAVPIRDAEQHLLGVTLVLADVTNLRRLDEMKSGLLSVVSHELKTPLTSIRMAVHLLMEERIGPLNPKQIELLIAAREDSDRLDRIIAGLLDMGRLESGGVELDLRPIEPSQLVNDAISQFSTAYHDRGIALEADIAADISTVLVDTDRIDHVLSNLLSNSLKFTAPGGRVKVSAVNEDKFVRFAVEDTGVGIPAESLPRIFERFYRVPSEKQVTGAGLGLAIAREIIEAHGGRVSAQSNVGQGTTISFTLQRADAAPTPMDANSNGRDQLVNEQKVVC